ncbi:MAG: preprotein translocase subunit SecG [Chloracidobacterium sp.]|nr:preprotein translocase subunit SecG [Chloracidobacterium sp.]
MVYFLYGVFFLSCLLLVAAVLLQPGKTDAGALFTSNVSSSAFAPRGTTTVLSKVTIVAACVFMVSALLLSMPALTGNTSVLSSNPEAPAEANTNANTADSNSNANAAATDANANANPAATDANANSNVADAGNANTAAPAGNVPPADSEAPANK